MNPSKLCVAVFYIISSLLFLFGCASQPQSNDIKLAQRYVELADEHIKVANYPAALIELDQAARLYSNYPPIYSKRALAYFGLQRWQEAQSELKRAEKLGGLNSELQLLYAEYYSQTQQVDKAIAAVQTVIEDTRFPFPHLAHTQLGKIYLLTGDNQRALNAIERGLNIQPQECMLRNLKVQSLNRLQRQREALRFSGLTIKYCPMDSRSQLWYGYTLHTNKRNRDALRHFAKVRPLFQAPQFIAYLDQAVELLKNQVPLEEPLI